jgi:hypothetical protein
VSADPLAPLLELPGVRAAADGARAAVDRLLAHRVLRRRSAEVSAESALRGARASAALEGADHPLDKVRAGLGDPVLGDAGLGDAGLGDAVLDDPVLQGALRVSTELGRLVGTWQRAPAQVLARLHVLAASGLAPREELGRPAADPETATRLAGLAALVAGGTDAPAVVLAAVHAELRALVPFRTGSGVVARAAARLTVICRGLDPKALAVPEVGHLELRAEYDDALSAYASGDPEGIGWWLWHCCAATELGAREGMAICEAILRG